MFLKDLNPGDKGKILSYGKEHPEYRRRLLMLGATPGAQFEVVRIAPLGDPVETAANANFNGVPNVFLCIRKKDKSWLN